MIWIGLSLRIRPNGRRMKGFGENAERGKV